MLEDGIGVPGTPPSTTPLDQQAALATAVRETIRGRSIDLLRERGILRSPDLLRCARCGDRVISLDEPATYAVMPRDHTTICAACHAELDFIHMVRPDADIGGEGG